MTRATGRTYSELSLPGPRREQTVRYIHSQAEPRSLYQMICISVFYIWMFSSPLSFYARCSLDDHWTFIADSETQPELAFL